MYDSKHRTTGTHIHDTRKDGSGYSSTKREWNPQAHRLNEETSNHRKYMRTQSTTNNRVASNSSSHQQQHENGAKKTVKDAKKPLRVSGDWSEFKSSTGKTYFYNCKTEISQWEKPKGWLSDELNQKTNTSSISSKESTPTISSSVRVRYKVAKSSTQNQSSQIPNLKLVPENLHDHQNGNHVFEEVAQSNEHLLAATNSHLPTPDDDNSRMSFSSASSKESSSILTGTNNISQCNGSTLLSSESAVSICTPVSDTSSKTYENNSKSLNENDNKNPVFQSMNFPLKTTESISIFENESPTSSISKAERDQDIQKYYRGELIQHLTNWSSTQLEKQCFKLFDDYYGYTAKMSTTFTELKALKSNFRVIDIKRNILTQRLVHCQKYIKGREEDKNV